MSDLLGNPPVVAIQTIVVDGMKKGMRAAKGVGGSWELKVFGNDGTTTTTTSKWSFIEVDQKQVVMVWTDVNEDGNPKQDVKMSLERQPRRKRPTR